MYSLSVYDSEKKAYVSAYADFYSYDPNTWQLNFVSFAGFDSAVQSIKAAIWKHKTINLDYKYCYPNGSYRTFSEKIDEYTHTIMISEDAFNVQTKQPLIVVWNNNRNQAVMKVLQEKFTIPLLDRWADWLIKQLINQNYLLYQYVYGIDIEAYRLDITEDELTKIVLNGLEYGTITINGELNFDIQNITMANYLKKYSNVFSQKIEETYRPLYDPLKPKNNELIKTLKTKPFKAQEDVIMASVETLKKKKNIIVVGEMGTGKTALIGPPIPYIHADGKPYNALVMCPGHLINKWKRQIEATIPNAEAVIMENWKDVLKIPKSKDKIRYYIISKDKAKLGYAEKVAIIKHLNGHISCPVCGKTFKDKDDIPLTEDYFKTHTTKNDKCPYCKTKLWQADKDSFRRYPVAEYIKRHMKNFFDYFIADEVHELKGGDTAQGNSFGVLSGSCKKTIALTGTLLGGYPTDIFYLLYRLNPKAMLKDGIGYKDVTLFVERYGAIETIIKEKDSEYNRTSKGKQKSTRKRMLPVISPLIFSKFLLDQCVFLQLSDLQQSLPKYTEEVQIIEPDDELKEAYDDLADELKDAIFNADKNMLSTYLMTLLRYPDSPFNNESIPVTDYYQIVPKDLPEDFIYNKEQHLLNYVLDETNKGRNVFIYAQFTGQKDVTKRLENLLNGIGIKTCTLKTTVKQEKREEWLDEKVKDGYRCIISNFELVKTGLDLLDFPTIIFYETGYNTFTLRQASKRSWRIGQTKPVKVVFMVYKDTLQYNALALMGNKLEAAMNIEGKFSEEGLRALSNTNNIMVELAKSLVNGLDENISIEKIWQSQSDNIIDLSAFFKSVKVNYSKRKKSQTVEQLCFDFDALQQA
ncbi:DEAD/DEAH box helicase family protein [Thermoanaerobacterium thermosaccharolyticum]|uniref:DEAD/DEAH box helicase family protein n=1 Tax=Thermoanaerobacterium thermosaccharolyticum TaxID=1517 RepID=UPI003DA7E7CD